MTGKRFSRCSFGGLIAASSIAVLLLAGCVASDLEIRQDRASSIRKIAVHPIEAPQLVVPSGSQLAMEAGAGYGELLGVLGIVVGGVVIATKTESLSKEAEQFDKYTGELEADEIWQPSVLVAQQIASRLMEKKRYEVDIHLPMTKLFGGDQKGWFDEYGPVRSWYNGDEPANGTLSADSDVVIEAGIWNYELAQGLFVLAVVLRAVDPDTGEVLGRARAVELPPARDVESLFANGAEGFKTLFTNTSDRLTRQALDQLGF